MTNLTEKELLAHSLIMKSTMVRPFEDFATDFVGQMCGKCFRKFPESIKGTARHYTHPGGQRVEGSQGRQWITVICTCGYQMSHFNMIRKLKEKFE